MYFSVVLAHCQPCMNFVMTKVQDGLAKVDLEDLRKTGESSDEEDIDM